MACCYLRPTLLETGEKEIFSRFASKEKEFACTFYGIHRADRNLHDVMQMSVAVCSTALTV
jgi:hypothetical protein